ncbi:alpha/beta-hydrolase [Corynespora cassiicola Philippines]|uniref:Alpha/beta-hydrolase n=1 Tax=Corynespora cassiicola Philippines TaxID=1448308 RepID=A0A2T2P318_CORCC|nr:alpha/beta-hydrolase [Corynespora cassiicola Philippines]
MPRCWTRARNLKARTLLEPQLKVFSIDQCPPRLPPSPNTRPEKMDSSKPTLVFVHGAWHTPKHYTKMRTGLQKSGFEVHIPHLPSVSEARPPVGDMYTDTSLIRSYVEGLVEAGRKVVVVGHSYGGFVATNALYDLGLETRQKADPTVTGGVTHLIFLCASAFDVGDHMISLTENQGQEYLIDLAFEFTDDKLALLRAPRDFLVGSGEGGTATEEEIEAHVGSLINWRSEALYQRLEHAAWEEIPTAYLFTTLAACQPVEHQRLVVENMRKNGREVVTAELATGHSPTLTMPEACVDFINEVVAGKKA